MIHKELVTFIKEARKQGYDDYQIKEPLMKNGWHIEEIEEAFASLKPHPKFKNKVCIYLDSDVLKLLDRRARRNMFTLTEQIDDILRRSVLNAKKLRRETEKLDDMLIGLFSRKRKK